MNDILTKKKKNDVTGMLIEKLNRQLNSREKICQFPENLSRIVNGFYQKSSFFSLPDWCFKNQIIFFFLSSLEDWCEHCSKNVNRSEKEIDENSGDNYLDMR